MHTREVIPDMFCAVFYGCLSTYLTGIMYKIIIVFVMYKAVMTDLDTFKVAKLIPG